MARIKRACSGKKKFLIAPVILQAWGRPVFSFFQTFFPSRASKEASSIRRRFGRSVQPSPVFLYFRISSASLPQSARSLRIIHSGVLSLTESALSASVSGSGSAISSFFLIRFRRMPLHTPFSPGMPFSWHNCTQRFVAALSGIRSSRRIWQAPSRRMFLSRISVSGLAMTCESM